MANLTPDERRKVLGLVGGLVRTRLAGPEADALLGRIDAHVAAAEDYLLRDVNPARADRDGAWDQARGEA